jgi:hypothetical protein
MVNTKVYLRVMGIYWLGFGLITSFYPALMDLFQTDFGIESKTSFWTMLFVRSGVGCLPYSIWGFSLARKME